MTGRRWAALGAVVVLLALALGWLLGPGGAGEAPEPTPSGPGANPQVATSARERCAERLVRLREEAERLGMGSSDLGPLRDELALAAGQSARVAGRPVAPPDPAGPEGEQAIRAGMPPDSDVPLVGVDCEEYPCILELEGPAYEGQSLSTMPFRTVIHRVHPSGLRFLWSRAAVVDDRVHGFVAFTDPGRPETRAELQARVRFRVTRRLALDRGEEVLAPAPPDVRPPPPVSPDPCGPEHERLKAELRGEGEEARLKSALEWHRQVVELLEGQSVPFPEGLPDRFHEVAAWTTGDALAAQLDLELTDVDCTEFPCLIGLAATLPGVTDVRPIEQRLREARERLEGYDPGEVTWDFSLLHGRGEGHLFLRVRLHPADAELDEQRLKVRDERYMEPAAVTSTLDWSQPLP